VFNLSRTPVVQAAWAAGATLRLHGVVYRLEQGLLRDIGVTLDGSLDGIGDDTLSAVGGGRFARAPRKTPAASLRDGVLRLG
jgi:hypothetical protein